MSGLPDGAEGGIPPGERKEKDIIEQMINQLSEIVETASDFIWDSVLLYVLVFTGILFTIRLGFIQVRNSGPAGARCSAASASPARKPARTA